MVVHFSSSTFEVVTRPLISPNSHLLHRTSYSSPSPSSPTPSSSLLECPPQVRLDIPSYTAALAGYNERSDDGISRQAVVSYHIVGTVVCCK